MSDIWITADPGIIIVSGTGECIEYAIVPPPGIVTVGGSGTSIEGVVIYGNVVIATIIVGGKGDVWLVPSQKEWVWTSRIGLMDFTDSDTGEVTKRPMSFSGWIYAIKKLGNSAIIYGENGIAMMMPVGVNWGLRDIHPIGLMGKNAVIDTKDKHLFIDKKRALGIIQEGQVPQLIDYSRWFNALNTKVVMSYDPSLDIVFICDGALGFVYSDSGLGKGPVNVAGIGFKDITLYATAPDELVFDPFNVCFDIIDFGVRTEKTITEVDFGINLSNALYCAIDYRWNKAQDWFTSPWVKADYQGRTFHFVSGVEFRIRTKLLTYEEMELDYGNVIGKYADLKPLGGIA